MLTVLGAAAVLGVFAPTVQAFSWGVPFGMLSVGMVVRSACGAALTGLVAGSLLYVVFSSVPNLSEPEAGLWAGAFALGFGLALTTLAARRSRRLRGGMVLAYRLRDPEIGPEAFSALDQLITRAERRASASEFATLVLLVTSPMTNVERWDELAGWLARIERDAAEPHQRPLIAQALASCRLHIGDIEGALEALEGLERPAKLELVEAWLVATEAWALSVKGEPRAALDLVGEEASADDALLRASRRIARAHAFAGLDQPKRAERELQAVMSEAGEASLGRALRPEGPASKIARALSA